METFDTLKQQTDVCFVQIDSNGIIMDVNQTFENCFGWTREEIIGKPVLTIIPRELHDAHNLGFSRFLSTEIPTLMQKPLILKARKKDGTVFPAEHYIIGEKQGDDWVFAATIRSIS